MAEFNEDLEDIRVTEHTQREDGWTFLVEVGHGEGLIEYFVDLDKSYWDRITSRRVEPTELIKATFKFLLEKEPKEIILKKFNVSDVAGYFPTFENEIKKSI